MSTPEGWQDLIDVLKGIYITLVVISGLLGALVGAFIVKRFH